MRILLVTFNDILPFAVNEVLNFELDFSAVVVEDIEAARKILTDTRIFSLHDLQETLRDINYYVVVCISDKETVDYLPEQFRNNNVPKNKFIHLYDVTENYNFNPAKKFQTVEENPTEFEIFSTSPAYSSFGLQENKFTKKIFDFFILGQDLY